VVAGLAVSIVVSERAASGQDDAGSVVEVADGVLSESLAAPPPIDPGTSAVETFVTAAGVARPVVLPGDGVESSVVVAGEVVRVDGLPVELRVLTAAEVTALEAVLAHVETSDADAVGGPGAVGEGDAVVVDGSWARGSGFEVSDGWVAGVAPDAAERAKVSPVGVEVVSLPAEVRSALGAQGVAFSVRPSEGLTSAVWVEVEVCLSLPRRSAWK
jgi:hypothetical protein